MRPFEPGSARHVLPAGLLAKQEKNKKSRSMSWTLTNLLIELIAGIVGGHMIAAVAKEHSFGALGHTIAGALGGGLSGFFLQTLAGMVVDSAGNAYQATDQVTEWFIQGVTGLIAGAMVTMAIGFAKQPFEQQRLGRS